MLARIKRRQRRSDKQVMVNEVNKLIYNAIINHKTLYLPDVGNLCVVRYPSTINSKNEVIPPRYLVEFNDDSPAISLIDIISSVASVDSSRAEEIYHRWLDKSKQGGVLKIDRVGTLSGKSFICDAELIRVLNPKSNPISITYRKSSKLPLILSLCVVLIAIGYGTWWYVDNSDDITELVSIVDNESTIDNTILNPEIENFESDINIVSEVADEQIIEVNTADWRDNDNIRHWVVVGSYSSVENAERAIADIIRRMPDAKCSYFKLGSMYAVAVFGSENLSECQEFKRSHINDFTQSWVFTPKQYR